MFYAIMQSPVGRLRLAADPLGLRRIDFLDGDAPAAPVPAEWREDAAALRPVQRALEAYFARRTRGFDLLLAPEGTAFQLAVWSELRNIPYGETISYGELARRVGRPKAARAVGLANGSNPLPIVIPCHRVIGGDGRLTGYGGGLAIKERLLGLEEAQLRLPAAATVR